MAHKRILARGSIAAEAAGTCVPHGSWPVSCLRRGAYKAPAQHKPRGRRAGLPFPTISSLEPDGIAPSDLQLWKQAHGGP